VVLTKFEKVDCGAASGVTDTRSATRLSPRASHQHDPPVGQHIRHNKGQPGYGYLLPTTTSALATTMASTNGTSMPPTFSPSGSRSPIIHSSCSTLSRLTPPGETAKKSFHTNQHGNVFSNNSRSGSRLGSRESVAM